MDGNVYVYDFSELREEVKNVETQISEIVSLQSEAAEHNAEMKTYLQTETILLFAIIGFIGVVCGVVGALTWRSNKNG